MTPGEEMRRARETGRVAAESGRAPSTNPHHGTGLTPRERVPAVMWLRGYRAVTAGFPVAYES